VKIKKARRYMKGTLKKALVNLRADLLLKQLNKTPRVLFWHGVDDIVDQTIEAETFQVETFQKQIKYLKENYNIISIDEFYLRLTENRFKNNEVVLTFDDGYSNNLYKVAPILNNLSLPFTVFISTEHIETGELYPTSIARLIILGSDLNSISIPSISIYDFDITTNEFRHKLYAIVSMELKSRPLTEVRKIVQNLIDNLNKTEYLNIIEKYNSVKPMNWDEVVKLKKMGATIGSHCKYHICCHENQNVEIVKDQIIESKRIIEAKLQTYCHYFAYPNGDYTEDSNLFVKEAGYKLGFSTDKNQKVSKYTDKTIIPRIGVPQNIDTFKLFINIYPKK
jgi:peptidoglycan/xylan/chitin deacetylase (PgdA/CDA1 family)